MSTFMAKAGEVERQWYVVDAAGKTLGRLAVQVADLLRGKNKTTFTPHVDCGDFVIVINADKIVLTGKKAEQKMYRHMKSVRYDNLLANRPELAVQLAVKGMIPSNTIGRKAMTRLHIYKGAEHKHAAQKPVVLE